MQKNDIFFEIFGKIGKIAAKRGSYAFFIYFCKHENAY